MSLPPTARDPLLAVIVNGLAPYIGANMARAAVDNQVDKLRLRGALRPDDLDRLLAAIEPGLAVFVGRPKTAQIVAEIQASLVPGRLAARASDPDLGRRSRPGDVVTSAPPPRAASSASPSGKPKRGES